MVKIPQHSMPAFSLKAPLFDDVKVGSWCRSLIEKLNILIKVLNENRLYVDLGLSDGTRDVIINSLTANYLYGNPYLLDSGTAYYLSFLSDSTTAFAANRTLTYDLDNASRILKITGNPTIADWFDQSVKTSVGPSFDHVHLTVTTGTAPLEVTSTTKVGNLNVEQVDGADLSIDGTMASNSDALIPSQKAVVTYVTSNVFVSELLLMGG